MVFSSKLDQIIFEILLLTSKYHKAFEFGKDCLQCLFDFKCFEIQQCLLEFRHYAFSIVTFLKYDISSVNLLKTSF